jgi:hypothetical protein
VRRNYIHNTIVKRLILFLLAFLGSSNLTWSQSRFVKVWLYEEDSFTRVPFVVVSIKNKTTATLSDEAGYLELYCDRNDTLVVGHVTYQRMYIPVKNLGDSTKNKIYLKKIRVELVPVTISGNRLSKSKIEEYQHHLNRTRPNISSPISLIYESLSRRGKERTKMDLIYSELLLRDQLEQRLPPRQLFLITGNRSVTLDNLLMLCPVDSYFVMYSSEYDFFYHFSKCWEDYKKLH